MELYYYNALDGTIRKSLKGEKYQEEYGNIGILLADSFDEKPHDDRTKDSDFRFNNKQYNIHFTVSEKSMEELISIIDHNHIRTNRILLFSPELFMIHQMKNIKNHHALLKLDNYCISSLDGHIKRVNLLDYNDVYYAKYMGKSCVFDFEVSNGK